MGLRYSHAIPSNTVKSIKILAPHVKDNEHRKRGVKEQTADEDEENSNKKTIPNKEYLIKKQLWNNDRFRGEKKHNKRDLF